MSLDHELLEGQVLAPLIACPHREESLGPQNTWPSYLEHLWLLVQLFLLGFLIQNGSAQLRSHCWSLLYYCSLLKPCYFSSRKEIWTSVISLSLNCHPGRCWHFSPGEENGLKYNEVCPCQTRPFNSESCYPNNSGTSWDQPWVPVFYREMGGDSGWQVPDTGPSQWLFFFPQVRELVLFICCESLLTFLLCKMTLIIALHTS